MMPLNSRTAPPAGKRGVPRRETIQLQGPDTFPVPSDARTMAALERPVSGVEIWQIR
jgi:hypothetical protein